jgi:hypothetical protein
VGPKKSEPQPLGSWGSTPNGSFDPPMLVVLETAFDGSLADAQITRQYNPGPVTLAIARPGSGSLSSACRPSAMVAVPVTRRRL